MRDWLTRPRKRKTRSVEDPARLISIPICARMWPLLSKGSRHVQSKCANVTRGSPGTGYSTKAEAFLVRNGCVNCSAPQFSTPTRPASAKKPLSCAAVGCAVSNGNLFPLATNHRNRNHRNFAGPRIMKRTIRIVRKLNAIVVYRGVFPQHRFDTATYHLVQRTIDELTQYVEQDLRPTICAGAPEMADFYARRLAPIRKSRNEAKSLLAELRRAVSAPTHGRNVKIPPDPTGSKSIETLPTMPHYGEKIIDIAAAVLTRSVITELKSEPFALARLQRTHDILDKAPAAESSDAQRRQAAKELRTIEFAIYSEHLFNRQNTLLNELNTALNAIREGYTKSCICPGE